MEFMGKGRTSASAKSPSQWGIPIDRYGWAGLGGLGIATLAGMLVIALWFGHLYRETERDKGHAMAQAVVFHLTDVLDIYHRSLVQTAADPNLRALWKAQDTLLLATYQHEALMTISHALRLQIFPLFYQQQERESTPPFGFASLDLLRQVEKSRKPTAIELHLPGTAHTHFAAAAPIFSEDGKEPLAILYLAFNSPWLQTLQSSLGQYPGRLEIQQKGNNRALTLAVSPVAPAASATPSEILPIPNTSLQLAGWYQSPLFLTSPPELATTLSFVLVMLISIAAVTLHGVQLKRTLRADLGNLLSLSESLLAGQNPALGGLILRELWGTADRLRQMILASRTTARPGSSATIPATPGGMTEFATTHPSPSAATVPQQASRGVPPATTIPEQIFCFQDIRGLTGTDLTPERIRVIGQALGSQLYDLGQQEVLVGRDSRRSTPELAEALILGLIESGRDVLDIGLAPTPLLWFGTQTLSARSGVMVTGSHDAKEYNGLQIIINNETITSEELAQTRQRIESGNLLSGQGSRREHSLIEEYLQQIQDDVRLMRPIKVILDCANGVVGTLAPAVFRAIGCEVVALFSEANGNFPNHAPDPGRPENLRDLQLKVKQHSADLGLAFDDDGDRLGVIDSEGQIVWPDRVLMWLAADVLARHPGADILFDAATTRALPGEILQYGGRPLMWKAQPALLKAEMKRTGALLAGTAGGRFLLRERWFGTDDALYAGARLAELVAMQGLPSAEVLATIPNSLMTPELELPMAYQQPEAFLQRFVGAAQGLTGARLITVDGLRIEFEEGWGHVRVGDGLPQLVFRFEADSQEQLDHIQQRFRELLRRVEPDLRLPF
ncbi:MAG: phosphomannomutase/phosphoglucomutase [Pseudomonadota bacterium]